MSSKKILNSKEFEIILKRLINELIENHHDFSSTVLIGIQPRGTLLLKKIINLLDSEFQLKNVASGILDITFFRDDFRRREHPLQANATSIEVLLENKNVILIDDVLFTGRSVRAALTALDHYGRPNKIELLVLIDRRFRRELPIQPTYKGKQIDTFENEKIVVKWNEKDDFGAVLLESTEHKTVEK
jgi:pyrimidine operon attenuation protein/uracil phosphoribosyltransferase